ncbi:MAG TPA: STAS domain-containing protein, partial [Candidatus Limnocylindria bacterium]|nr:STAS domain-containing protein [Candidatus Limnocylindria bacterium]
VIGNVELHARRPAGPVVVCDASVLLDVDVGTVEALAWLALHARRLGASLRVEGASAELRALIDFMGLADVIVVVGAANAPRIYAPPTSP